MLRIGNGFAALLIMLSATHAFAYDLTDPKDRLDAYIKAVGDLSGKQSVAYGKVAVYAKEPGKKGVLLFNLEVVGLSRFIPIEGGYRRLHREIAFYTDLETGEVLATWENPLNGRTVQVFVIQNDPVNFNAVVFEDEARNPKFNVYGDNVVINREVMLRYPSALPRAEYPLYSQADWYEAGEMFNTYVRIEDLENPDITSAPSMGSWSRFGPWLPWMEMADQPGMLVYHGHDSKLMNGTEDIPDRILANIKKDYPKYLHAPETDTDGPNDTSWTVFKKIIDAQREQ